MFERYYFGPVAAAAPSFTPAIAYVGATEYVRTDTSDPWSDTFTPSGTPAAIVVLVCSAGSSTDNVSGVTYGGVALTNVAGIGSGDPQSPCYVDMWLLGSGVPTGAQTVALDLASGTTDDLHIVVVELSAAANVEAVTSGTDASASSLTGSVALSYGGRRCIALGILGANKPDITDVVDNANMTQIHTHDFGAANPYVVVSHANRQTTPGTSDFTFSYTWPFGSDGGALVAAAFSEVGS